MTFPQTSGADMRKRETSAVPRRAVRSTYMAAK
jgi:hypothetical protein